MVEYVGHDLATPRLLLFGMVKWICDMSQFPRKEFQAYVAACEHLTYSRLDTEFSQEECRIVQHYQAELLALLNVPNPPL